MKKFKKIALFLVLSLQTYTAYGAVTDNNYDIKFNSNKYEIKTLTLKGQTIKFRAFEKIVYVKNPVDTKYQIMNFYVPEDFYTGKKINGYSINTAPIFLPNEIGGYMPAEPGIPGAGMKDNSINASFIALLKGYVVASPGARGRTTKDSNGIFTGKAPAGIVDLKAAVAYLHYNDASMPGDANKIISNGTSAGGAMSSLLGATGDNEDYLKYLKEIGTADASTSIYAVSAYCPITDLDHADMAYEWLLNGVNNYKKLEITRSTDYKIERKFVEGNMTENQIKLSEKLSELYPTYINNLKLKDSKGNLLSLDKNGNGTFKEYIKTFLIASAQKALDSGTNLSEIPGITIKDNKVINLDLNSYYKYVGRMKATPAFDGVDLSTGENDEFGTPTKAAQHFTDFGMKNDIANGTMANSELIKMMNPLNYLGTKGTNTAKYWRIRHGALDVDTSVSVSATLATTLNNKGYSVDYFVPWATPHSGDYDLEELFAWIDSISK